MSCDDSHEGEYSSTNFPVETMTSGAHYGDCEAVIGVNNSQIPVSEDKSLEKRLCYKSTYIRCTMFQRQGHTNHKIL